MRRIFAVVFLITCTISVYAQNVQFTAAAQRVVSQGERFRVTFSVNADAGSFTGPDFKGLSVLSGPNRSNSSSISVINGAVTKEESTSFSYIVVGNNPGTFTVNAATCAVGGKNFTSNSLSIEVVKGNTQQQNQQQAQQQQAQQQQAQQQAANSGNISDSDVFVRVAVDKNSVYLGEPVVATIKIYTKLSLADFKNYKFPTFNGFYSQAIKEPDRITLERENVGGEIYETGLFKQVLLYPQVTGKVEIEPFELEAILRVPVRRQSFFDPGYREVSKKLSSKKIVLTVNELPKPAPAGFKGAVGDFAFKLSVDKTSLKADEAFNLTAKISGSGNMRLIEQLGIEFPTDFEVYDPKIADNFTNSVSGTKGNKVFEYLIIPRHAGTFEIPAVNFTYFDLNSKKYKTLNSSPISIEVAKGEGGESNSVVQSVSKEQVKYLGKDIRYIKQGDYRLEASDSFFFGSLAYYLCLAVPSLLFVFLVLIRRKQIAESKDVARTRNRKASKLTKKRLKLAHQHLKSDKENLFYEELVRALWGYLSDKLSIPMSELTKDTARTQLIERGVPEETVTMLLELMDTCEFARYAPTAANTSKPELLKTAESVLNKLESTISTIK